VGCVILIPVTIQVLGRPGTKLVCTQGVGLSSATIWPPASIGINTTLVQFPERSQPEQE
jgi:hypothetical protein